MSKLAKSAVFVLAFLLAASAFAYDFPLTSQAIRNAWFLGNQRDKRTSDFLARYTHHFPMPASGPRVASIQIETPYVQVVQRSAEAHNFTPLDAEREFLGKPAVFSVRVRIDLTSSYSAVVATQAGKSTLRPDDFWQSFKIKLFQGAEIRPIRVEGRPLYQNGAVGPLMGAEVQLEFSANQLHSAPLAIEVLPPTGQKIQTTFDLAALP